MNADFPMRSAGQKSVVLLNAVGYEIIRKLMTRDRAVNDVWTLPRMSPTPGYRVYLSRKCNMTASSTN